MVYGAGLRIQGSRFRELLAPSTALVHGGSGFSVPCARVWGSRFRVQGTRFKVQGAGYELRVGTVRF
jgi:hypothetical protein